MAREMRNAKERRIKKTHIHTHTTPPPTPPQWHSLVGQAHRDSWILVWVMPDSWELVSAFLAGSEQEGMLGCSAHLHLAGTVSRNSQEG